MSQKLADLDQEAIQALGAASALTRERALLKLQQALRKGLASKHLDWTLTFESLWTSSLWQERLGGLLGAKEGPS
ncbi:hypothetical protein WJX84_012246 [Apatococcus fuscideae]|uniref:DUF2191 domain-containing protein n=1 Tax=Apatococcus fuscideae TaxID=2026836 RepID=A0AAW1TA93_9CHLO